MGKLQELIEKYCPDGVSYKPLGELGELVRGNGLQKKDFVEEGIGCIHYGQIYTRFGTYTDTVLSYVTEELAEKLLHVKSGDLVIAVTSENIEDVCKAVAWIGKDEIVTGGHCVVFRHDMDPKYVAYCFQTDGFAKQKRKVVRGTKVIEAKASKLAKVVIPVPPIEVQREVVRLLDAQTASRDALIAKLNEEIGLRNELLAEFRNQLLSFPEK